MSAPVPVYARNNVNNLDHFCLFLAYIPRDVYCCVYDLNHKTVINMNCMFFGRDVQTVACAEIEFVSVL
jgi:hypothetical protein